MKSSVIVFIIVCMISALIAWLGGFNFDRRNVDVGAWSIMTLLVALFISVMYYDTVGRHIKGENK